VHGQRVDAAEGGEGPVTVFVVASTTATVPWKGLATKTLRPSGVTAAVSGMLMGSGTVATTASVAVSMTVRSVLPWFGM
jgi:hypothetical protein